MELSSSSEPGDELERYLSNFTRGGLYGVPCFSKETFSWSVEIAVRGLA